jgi:peroxiredoxin
METGVIMSKTHSAAYRRKQKAKEQQQKKIMLIGGAGLALVLLGALLWLSMQSGGSQLASGIPAPVQPGNPAPDFELKTLDGETAVLQDHSGEVILINFWATWCPPCKAEMPDLNAYYLANQEKGFTILGVNAQEDQKTVSNFIQATGFSFPILLDSFGDVANQYQVHSYPTTIVVGRDGEIKYIHNGIISPTQLETIVTPLLSG